MTRDDFMENTLDVWEIPAESARRIGHPAPFPVELPARLIELYTYRGDLVLDPFAGSGTTAVAALRSGRHFAGYDLDESYVRLAETRVAEERQRLARDADGPAGRVTVPASPASDYPDEDTRSRSVREGRAARELARSLIEAAGFSGIEPDRRLPGGVEVGFAALDTAGNPWLFDVAGTFTRHRGGLKRSEVLWKALGKAAVLREVTATPLVLLTAERPAAGAGADTLGRVVGPGKPIHAVVEMLAPNAVGDLRALRPEERRSS